MAIKSGRVGVAPDQVDAYGRVVASDYLVDQLKEVLPPGVETEPLSVTENGTYTAPTGKAYTPVTVNVSSQEEESWVDKYLDLKPVVFVDYDGSIPYNYTVEEFMALTEMPANPTHSGLVSQGWNWSLASAKEFASEYGCICIGQNYTTDDGSTRIYANLDGYYEDAILNLNFPISDNGVVEVDWGDGSEITTVSGNGNKNISHTYLTTGNVVVKIKCTSGRYKLGNDTSSGSLVGGAGKGKNQFQQAVRKIEIGDNCTQVNRSGFGGLINATEVTIPTTCANYGSGTIGSAFIDCPFKAVIYPRNVVFKGTGNCGNKYFVSLPETPIENNSLSIGESCLMVTGLVTNSDMATTTYLNRSGGYLRRCMYYALGGLFTTVSAGYCQGANVLKKMVLHRTVSVIKDYAMNDCYSCELYLQSTTPPTLENTRGIGNIYRIYVPESSVADYQVATNWSSFASKIYGY